MSVKDVTKSWDQEDNIADRQIKALENSMSGFSCLNCKHLNKDNISCAAFPDVIPHDIKAAIIDHREPFPGDNGIRFEPI